MIGQIACESSFLLRVNSKKAASKTMNERTNERTKERKKERKKERLWPQLQNTRPNHQTEQFVLYWFGTRIFANETWAPDLWLAQSCLITLNMLLLSFCVVSTQARFNCNQGLFCRVARQKLNPLFHSVLPRTKRCYWSVCMRESKRLCHCIF